MNIFKKWKQKRNFKQNQADSIFKGNETIPEKVEKFQLIDGFFGDRLFEVIDQYCVCTMLGREALLDCMQIAILVHNTAMVSLSESKAIDGIDVIASAGRQYSVLIGTIGQFYRILRRLDRSNSYEADFIMFLKTVMLNRRYVFSGENHNWVSNLALDPFKEISIVYYTDPEVTYFKEGISNHAFVHIPLDISADKKKLVDLMPFASNITMLNDETAMLSIKKWDYYAYSEEGKFTFGTDEAVEVIRETVDEPAPATDGFERIDDNTVERHKYDKEHSVVESVTITRGSNGK